MLIDWVHAADWVQLPLFLGPVSLERWAAVTTFWLHRARQFFVGGNFKSERRTAMERRLAVADLVQLRHRPKFGWVEPR